MKLPCIFFLCIVALIVIFYEGPINKLFGGGDVNANCFICTKVNYNGYFTNWTLSHFVVFVIAAYFCPRNIYILIVLGIAWEIVELYLEYTSKFNHGSVLCKAVINCDTTDISKTHFWHHYFGIRNNKLSLFWCSGGFVGSLLDIVANILGVFTGRYFFLKTL